jgi:uncharacterized protein YkwD
MHPRSRNIIFISLIFLLPLAGYLTFDKNKSEISENLGASLFSLVRKKVSATFLNNSYKNNELGYLYEDQLDTETLDNYNGDQITQSKESFEEQGRLVLSSQNIIWFINKERMSRGLNPLIIEQDLMATTDLKNNDMILFNYFEHINPVTNASIDVFLDTTDYSFIKVAENLAVGNFLTSKEVVDAWMKSPGHRKNILDPYYKETGVSVTKAFYQGSHVFFITQHFGNPRNSCPGVDENRKNYINELRFETQSLSDRIADAKQQIGEYESRNVFVNSEYDRLITEHNELVREYNNLIIKLQTNISLYNEQVKLIESCIAQES